MTDSSPIIHPTFLPIIPKQTAPRTKVVAVLSFAAAFLIGAVGIQPYGIVTGICLMGAAGFSFLAWKLYRKIGFAGDEDEEASDDRRDEYCV